MQTAIVGLIDISFIREYHYNFDNVIVSGFPVLRLYQATRCILIYNVTTSDGVVIKIKSKEKCLMFY